MRGSLLWAAAVACVIAAYAASYGVFRARRLALIEAQGLAGIGSGMDVKSPHDLFIALNVESLGDRVAWWCWMPLLWLDARLTRVGVLVVDTRRTMIAPDIGTVVWW